MRTVVLACAALLLAAPLVLAGGDPDDAEGSKDHPDVARFPGMVITEYKFNDFNSFEFPLGPEKTVTKEGRYWEISYGLKDGARLPSWVEVVRNYENAFKKGKGKLQARQDDEKTAVYSMPLGKTERWMLVNFWNDGHSIRLTIVEIAAMEQKVEVSASEMLDALEKNGFIALYGVTFDTGKDTIKPESEPLLAEIVALLAQNGELRISVEGHTDNVGDRKVNEGLSRKRAESVKKWLTGKGIAAARMATQGFGDSRPIADNRTEDGRAKNRRVELVKK